MRLFRDFHGREFATVLRTSGRLHVFPVPLLAGRQHFIAVAFPPAGRKNLHLVHASITGGLDPGANQRNIDHPVAHHAPVIQQISGRHQPVANVERQDAIFSPPAPRARSALSVSGPTTHGRHRRRYRSPLPNSSQRSLACSMRIHAGPVAGVHRVQRLNGQRHAPTRAHTRAIRPIHRAPSAARRRCPSIPVCRPALWAVLQPP